MKELLEQGYGVTAIGILAGIGGVTRFILFGYYLRLLKACKVFEKTKNKSIVYIRQDLMQRAGKNQGIKSAMVYTECRLTECKVCGFRIGFLECILQQSLLVVPLCGVLAALAGVVSDCDSHTVLLTLLVSGGAVAALLGMDLFVGLREKSKRIRLCIRDYIENSWVPGTEWAMCGEEETVVKKVKKEKEKKSRIKRAERAARAEKRKDKPAKACHKKNGKAQEEKRRLTEELLRERRQLEARSFAEQRRKQREEEPIQQVQKEAAVTICEEPVSEEKLQEEEVAEVKMPEEKRQEEKLSGSVYEALLSEVLTEYLA